MDQNAPKTVGARAALALLLAALLSAALPARAGTVYRPGLWQASLSGAANWTDDVLAASNRERAPGTMMAEITSSTNNPITGTKCSWGDNRTWAYAGQMYMRAGVTYHFYKFLDDNGNYVVDGTTILQNHTGYNSFAHCSHTPATSGWKDVDLRFGNGGGGAGAYGLFGAGWNTNGISANQATGWNHIADPGDCSLLRVPTGESFSSADLTRMMIGPAGLTLVLSHQVLPSGATLYAVLDSADRGTDRMEDWASAVAIGSVPAEAGESFYLVPGAAAPGVLRLALVSRSLSDGFVEWLDPIDLSSVATDGELTVGASVSAQYDSIDVSVFVPSLGQASSVGLLVEVGQMADPDTVVAFSELPTATAAWDSADAHFGFLNPGIDHWVRVTATPDVGAPIVKVYQIATLNPRPVFSATVSTNHLAPNISLSFVHQGWGTSVNSIRVQVSYYPDFSQNLLNKSFAVNLTTMPTNVEDIVLGNVPVAPVVYFRFIATNSRGWSESVDVPVFTDLGGDNVWSGLSDNIDDSDAYVYRGGMPSPGNKLYFAAPAGLSPVIDRDVTMPSLWFWSGKKDNNGNRTIDTSYLNGYHSCGYDLSGTGLLVFTAERPILQVSKGTNVVRNPIQFIRSNSQTVYVTSQSGRLDLTGRLSLPAGVTNTTMRVNGEGGEVHFGGPSPDFMGRLFLESSFTMSLDSPFAMTNVNEIFFEGGWGSFTYLRNGTGAPMTFPRCKKVSTTVGWSSTRACFSGAPMFFPDATLVWYVRAFDGSTFSADVFVKDVVVGKNDNGGDAGLDKLGTGTLAVSGTTSWSEQNVKHYVRLRNGCFWAQTPSALPPEGDLFAPEGSNNNKATLGLSGDYAPKLDGTATPRVFQENANTHWGFTAFGGDRTVCWNADPSLNLTNTTSDNVSIRLTNALDVNSVGKPYTNYYAYPSRLMFGNRSEFAEGSVLFLNPIRYELGQNWDTATYFESTNHVVAARLRGSLKLGNRDRTWNFSGRSFGGYLALEAENTDFTGRVSVTEKGNLLVNSNLVARSAAVQTGSGLGGVGSLETVDGTTVNNGGALFGGEWDKGGFLTLGGKLTFANGSALRAEVSSSNDRVGFVKLAPGSVLKLGSPVYVDVATDPRVTPVRGTAIKVLDWSEATFDAGRAPTAADFTARPESNSDIRKLYLFVRDDCLYVSYVSVRYPPATLMMLR